MEKIKFILFESFISFKRYPMYSIISSLTVSICLLLISFIFYLSNVSNNISDNFKNSESVIDLYINNSLTDIEGKKICLEISNNLNLPKITFINKEILLSRGSLNKNLKKWLNNDISFAPCLCSLNLIESSNPTEIIDSIKKTYGDKIFKISYPESYILKFDKFISSIYSFILVIGIILIIVSIFNVSNIIRLSVETRKNIIETLKLHGATNSFIRAPFIIEGLIQGVIGALISNIIIFTIFNLITLDNYNHFLINSFITTVSFSIYFFLNIIIGSLLGFIGSNLGTANYLD